MSAIGVSTIKPPELDKVKGDEIVLFELSYERYVRQISEFNLNRTPSQQIKPCGIKACVSAELLLSLTTLGTFPNRDTVSHVTDQDVVNWIKSRSRCSTDEMSHHVKDAIDRVKFKADRSDAQGSALQFFTDIMTEFRRNRVEHVIDEAPKAVFAQLVAKIEPPLVRETVRSEHEYWPADKKYDFHYFMKKVMEISIGSAKYQALPGKKRDRDDEFGGDGGKSAKNSKKNRKEDHSRKQGFSVDKTGKHKKEKTRGRNEAKWTDKCLNDKCDGVHPVKDCPLTSEEQKQALLRKHYEEKRKFKIAKLHGGAMDGRWQAILENNVHCVALGDIGADHSAIPRSIVERLKQSCHSLSLSPIEPPVELTGAINLRESKPATASATITLSITLSLPCGPLRLRRVEFLVVDHEMNEIILGRPLLRCLGFDLESHLEKHRAKLDNADVGKLASSLKLAGLSGYRGLWYNKIDDDPIPLPEEASANIGVDDEEDVQTAFQAALEKAKKNGMSANGIQTAALLLKDFRDIFRISLGHDPPADVAPLQIKLKTGHRPFRATQRKYAPPQRAFISATIRSLEKVKAVYRNPGARWASPALHP